MIHLVLNHKYLYEAQTITQLFFFGEKLITINHLPEKMDGFVVESRLTSTAVMGFVYKDGVQVSCGQWHLSNTAFYLSEKRMIMLALYYALQKVVKIHAPWGALTGIRPSKMIREWLALGKTDEEIIQILSNPFCTHQEKSKLALTVAHAENAVTQQIYKHKKNPVGIYISIPFCPTRCVYCSFNTSDKPASQSHMQQYVSAVEKECKEKAALLSQLGGTVSSIYIGGGTPTVLEPELLETMLNSINESIGTAPEYTIEAGRPDTLTIEKLKILKNNNATRITVNPQTLNDKTLKTIGRKHTAADFFKAFNMAREVGFNTINTDIIAGLPGETPQDMEKTMEKLATLVPENITVHTLAVKRASNLRLLIDDYELPNAANTEKMLEITAETCKKMGLAPYYLYRQKNMVGLFENVGYSLPQKECQYNVGMMAETQTVLGIGAGAVSKFVNKDLITRAFNLKNVELYITTKETNQ